MAISNGNKTAFKYKRKNVRIADFCRAEIRRPVQEVKVIAPHFCLHGKHQQKRSFVKFWCINVNTCKHICNYSFVPQNTGALISISNPDVHHLYVLPWHHLVCWCVILLGFFENGDKLKILWVFPSPPSFGSKWKREGRQAESKNREKNTWIAHETQKIFCGKASRVSLARLWV